MSKEDFIRAAKQDSMLKTPPVRTGSATEPAYLFTSLCPDPKRRKPPVRKKVDHEVKISL